MARWRSIAYTGAVLGPLLLSGLGCGGELPAPPPEVVKQAGATTPPVIDFGKPVSNDAAVPAKVAVKT